MPRRIRPHKNPLAVTKEIFFDGFSNSREIFVDVGAARGEFFWELLPKFPEKNFILFEIRAPLFFALQKKFANFENVKIFDGDAGRNFENILRKSADKIEKIFVNFPDPHFKKSHRKRRFLNKNFLEKISHWISPRTEWTLQTDQKFLFDETIEILQNSKFSKIKFFDVSPFGILTDWEKTKINCGAKIFRANFWKNF